MGVRRERVEAGAEIGGREKVVMRQDHRVVAPRQAERGVGVADPAEPLRLDNDPRPPAGEKVAGDFLRPVARRVDGDDDLVRRAVLREKGSERRLQERLRPVGRHADGDEGRAHAAGAQSNIAPIWRARPGAQDSLPVSAKITSPSRDSPKPSRR